MRSKRPFHRAVSDTYWGVVNHYGTRVPLRKATVWLTLLALTGPNRYQRRLGGSYQSPSPSCPESQMVNLERVPLFPSGHTGEQLSLTAILASRKLGNSGAARFLDWTRRPGLTSSGSTSSRDLAAYRLIISHRTAGCVCVCLFWVDLKNCCSSPSQGA